MKKNHTYRSTDVEQVDVAALLKALPVGCLVAIDVAKTKFVAALTSAAGAVVKLVRFEHPRQTRRFLELLTSLKDANLEPRALMEPTGTYGDAVRHQVHELGVPVHMMQPKHTHDIAEVIDGVPSMHDGKATVALARLFSVTSPRQWEPESEARRNLRAVLETRAPMAKTLELYHGHLEALLARHWPEFQLDIDVRAQRSWMPLLQKFPGPEAVVGFEKEATKLLWNASRGQMGRDRIERLVRSAKTTTGVPMMAEERNRLRHVIDAIVREMTQVDAVDERIQQCVERDDVAKCLAVVVGPACAAAIVSIVGCPTTFATARALQKALGLNLKERSSGEKKGRLGITKRGNAHVRQLLYLAALRLICTDPIVRAWYRARRSYKSESKTSAVVAVMRKVARALWHVARGKTFDARLLFDARRLVFDLPAPSADPSEESRFDGARQAPHRAAMKPKGGDSHANA